MKKIKILQIVPSLSLSNGVAAYLMNYYENMNLDKFDTTVLVLNDDEKGRYDAFKKCGCKIVELIKKESWPKYLKRIDAFFEENEFDIVHCHTPNYGAFYMYYAKKHGVKVRILHSHVNKSGDYLIKSIRNSMLIPIARKNSNYFVACSELAGKFMFKRREFKVLNNAIDCSKFKFDEEKRKNIRKELKIEDNYVIGEFGRFCPQKNQLFAIDIFKEILQEKTNAKLLLIGNGELKEKMKERIKEYDIEENVIILESKANINDYYNALDIFLLPSTYEGLGIVLIEAQVNSLPCYTSEEKVPKLAQVSPLLKYIELEKGADYWAKYIQDDKENKRKDYFDEIAKSEFNIKIEARKLEEYYLSFFK